MDLTSVTEICNQTKYTLEEANAMIPLIKRIGKKTDILIEKMLADQRYLMKSGASKERMDAIDVQVCKELIRWGSKLVRLGFSVVGNGIILFDSGFHFWVYHVGKEEITHSLDYNTPVGMMKPLPVVVYDQSRD